MLNGWRSNLHKASLLRSPPDKTLTFLSTSSPLNKKAPKISLTVFLFSLVAESWAVVKTVFEASRVSD